MAYIKKKSERKFKITVCNGYKVNGQKRMKAQTITVPSSVPKRGIQQYVMAEAERIEKKFKYGVEESDQTHFEQYAENWLKRQEPFFKATTYAGYKRNLDIVYPLMYERLPACLVTHRQVQRWIFTPTPLTRTSARRRKSWERRLDYDEENQINQRKQKHYAESACSLLLP